MGRFIWGKTRNCCVCYKPAIVWNGWLWKSRDGIVAGFCKEHAPKEPKSQIYNEKNRRGCFDKEMGIIEPKH